MHGGRRMHAMSAVGFRRSVCGTRVPVCCCNGTAFRRFEGRTTSQYPGCWSQPLRSATFSARRACTPQARRYGLGSPSSPPNSSSLPCSLDQGVLTSGMWSARISLCRLGFSTTTYRQDSHKPGCFRRLRCHNAATGKQAPRLAAVFRPVTVRELKQVAEYPI